MKKTFFLAVAVALSPACKTTKGAKGRSPTASELKDETPVLPKNGVKVAARTGNEKLKLCAAVRGNGKRIFAHFPAMARVIEHYGTFDAVAGGSSASITAFFYESIMMNPAVSNCARGPCSKEDTKLRVALLLKSLQSYLDYLATTEEALAFLQVGDVWKMIEEERVDFNVSDKKFKEAAAGMLTILNSPDIADVANKELIALLKNPEQKSFFMSESFHALKNFGKFTTDDMKILFRPGIVDFAGLAGKLGRIGSFYAGYGPSDAKAMGRFLNSCAKPGRGKTWSEIMTLEAGESSCGSMFAEILSEYREKLLVNEAGHKSRVDDAIGQYVPSLVSTSILTGETGQGFRDAYEGYVSEHKLAFSPNFTDVLFGYWGYPSDLEKIEKNPRGYKDLKTQKFLSLGAATWRYALSFSPAEPGLSRALPIEEEYVSAGGWSDLHPVQVLKNMGCEKVVYITRQGEESTFASGTAKLLGMSENEGKALYALENPKSGFASALKAADAVWCTDWDKVDGGDLSLLADDAYNAELVSKDQFFHSGEPYDYVSEVIDAKGCSL